MEDEVYSDFIVNRALEVYEEDSGRFRWFSFVLDDWGYELLDKLTDEAVLTSYRTSNLHNFACSIYDDPPAEHETGYFLESLSALSVATKKDLINPVYDLSNLLSEEDYTTDLENLKNSIEEAEKIISRENDKKPSSEYKIKFDSEK